LDFNREFYYSDCTEERGMIPQIACLRIASIRLRAGQQMKRYGAAREGTSKKILQLFSPSGSTL